METVRCVLAFGTTGSCLIRGSSGWNDLPSEAKTNCRTEESGSSLSGSTHGWHIFVSPLIVPAELDPRFPNDREPRPRLPGGEAADARLLFELVKSSCESRTTWSSNGDLILRRFGLKRFLRDSVAEVGDGPSFSSPSSMLTSRAFCCPDGGRESRARFELLSDA